MESWVRSLVLRKTKETQSILPAILAIFINQKLGFNTNTSTAIFHLKDFFLYFFTIVGAIIADSWLGLFKTISIFTLLFSVGAGMIAIVSVDTLQLPMK
jgi:solute carrier family 15 (oligopeptide transporter), member 1